MIRQVNPFRVLTIACLACLAIGSGFYLRYPSFCREQWRIARIKRIENKLTTLKKQIDKDPQRYESLLLHALKSDSLYAKGTAMAAIGKIKNPKDATMRALIENLYRVQAIATLGRIGPAAASLLHILPPPQKPDLAWQEALERVETIRPATDSQTEKLFAENHRQSKLAGIRGWQGVLSRIDHEEVHLISNNQDWVALWQRHAATQEPPAIDFSKHSVLAYFQGTDPAYGLHLDRIERKHGQLTAWIVFTGLPCMPADADYFPYLFAEIPRPTEPLAVWKEVPPQFSFRKKYIGLLKTFAPAN
jgi:hypothetical protein